MFQWSIFDFLYGKRPTSVKKVQLFKTRFLQEILWFSLFWRIPLINDMHEIKFNHINVTFVMFWPPREGPEVDPLIEKKYTIFAWRAGKPAKTIIYRPCHSIPKYGASFLTRLYFPLVPITLLRQGRFLHENGSVQESAFDKNHRKWYYLWFETNHLNIL